MSAFHVRMPAPEVVFLKGILEAHDGLAQLYSEGGGELCIACPVDQREDLLALLQALCTELPGMLLLGEREVLSAPTEG